MAGALPTASRANDLSSKGEVIMSCTTRRTDSQIHLRHGLLNLMLILLSAACSSGGDDGGGRTTQHLPRGGGGGNQFAYVVNFATNNVQAFPSDGNGNFTMVGQP